MARTQAASKSTTGNGVPRELTAGPPRVCRVGWWSRRRGRGACCCSRSRCTRSAYLAGKLLLVVLPVASRCCCRRCSLRSRTGCATAGCTRVPLAGRRHRRRRADRRRAGAGRAPFVSELARSGRTSRRAAARRARCCARSACPAEVDQAIDDGVKSLKGSGGKLAGGAVSGALAALNLLAAILLTLVLTFFFVKDGRQLWSWIAGCSARHQPAAEELGERIWRVLTGYVQGIALVALIDALLIGRALLVLGVPLAMPLTVLTFLAAFFQVVGRWLIGLAAVLVALVVKGGLDGGDHGGLDRRRPAARRQRDAARARRAASSSCTRCVILLALTARRRRRRPRRRVPRRAPRRGGGGSDRLRRAPRRSRPPPAPRPSRARGPRPSRRS